MEQWHLLSFILCIKARGVENLLPGCHEAYILVCFVNEFVESSIVIRYCLVEHDIVEMIAAKSRVV